MAVNDNPAIQSQVAPKGNDTQADPLFEKRLIELTKRERELTKREAGLKDQVSWDQIKDMAKKDRKAFFERLELEDFAPAETVDPLKKEMAELRAQIEADKKQKQDDEFRSKVLSQLGENPDKYELMRLLGNEDEIFQHYGKATREDGTPYEPLEIADIIEGNLYSKLEKIKSASKLKDWFKPAEQPKGSPNPTEHNLASKSQSHPLDSRGTLNSGDRGATSGEQPQRPLSRAEALAKAASHLQFKD